MVSMIIIWWKVFLASRCWHSAWWHVYGINSDGYNHAKPSVLPSSAVGPNVSCILLTLLVEFCNVSIVGFPGDAPKGGIGEGSKGIGSGKSIILVSGIGNASKDC